MVDVPLKCSCGEMRGSLRDVSAHDGRLVCYCDDCQAFAQYLEREADVLDEHGGTDIFQTVPAKVSFSQGAEHLRSVRLSPKGLIRWYAGCCNTPIGNTMSAGMPFVGLVHSIMDDDGVRDANIGPVRYYLMGKFAKGTPPHQNVHPKFPLKFFWRSLVMLLKAKWRGQNQPSPFFTVDGAPVSEPIIHEKTS